jgi:hypothetical protein
MRELRLTVFEHGHTEASSSDIQHVEVLAGQACADSMVNDGWALSGGG